MAILFRKCTRRKATFLLVPSYTAQYAILGVSCSSNLIFLSCPLFGGLAGGTIRGLGFNERDIFP